MSAIPSNGDGFIRRVAIPVLQTIIGALTIAAILGLLNLQNRVTQMESVGNMIELQRGLQHRADVHEGRLDALEAWKAEGRRFTAQDAEKMKAELLREIDRLQRQVDDLRTRRRVADRDVVMVRGGTS